ncbi:hypothetical protein BXY66_1062 [Shimia isoporae]|uniref:Lipoprotein n=1 Tax=Shimia isoporae TaxID=647720 RepID=A0A4V2Q3Y8_9RHOB|nr:hypothetical protein [Shimia isoporae]TCL09020.1 hypothetical protein BXY66_1062 [Shimia isoporae]
MVTNNKVLTVSYGTFSCTLEGFEDSFDTMKAIAEYFRDLAADDRYFGAEPPTPDAEMLARIAEREIERRVSARMDQGAIVLSAADRVAPEPVANDTAEDTAPEVEEVSLAEAHDTAHDEAAQDIAPEAPVVVDQETAEAVVVSENDEAAEEASTQDDAAGADVADVAVASAAAATVEAISESDEDAAEETVEAPAEMEVTDIVESDKAGDGEEAPVHEMAETDEAPSSEADDADGVDLGAVAEAASEDEQEEETVDYVAAEESFDAEIEEAEADDVFDSLAAADVLVLQDSIQAAIAEDTPSVAEDNSDDVQDIDVPDVEILDPVAEADDVSDDWDEEEPASDYEQNSIAAKLERIRAVVARGNSTADEDGFSEDEHARDLEVAEDAPAATVYDAEDDDISDIFAPKIQPVSDILDAAEEADEADAENDVVEASAEETAKPALRARVVRMKKADFEEAVASGLLEAEAVDDEEDDYADDDEDIFAEDAAPAHAVADSALTPEDEADLMAELAQVEAELKGDVTAQPEAGLTDTAPEELTASIEQEDDYAEDAALEETEETSEAPVEEPQSSKPVESTHAEPDLSRLMAKANSELEEPEGSRRRRAIAHLRAAVAATRAEKAAGNGTADKDDTVAYRDDLASVVRAVPGGKDGSTAEKSKPRGSAAPLKLVAEQRIDAPQDAPAKAPAAAAEEETKAPRRVPVRPRRVSSDRIDREEIARSAAPVGSVASVQGGFADYAKSVGAATMPQILEAAAAYVTFVKGQERFSRPMLIRMARDINEEEFSREESLRSFGQLLRDQKIRKIAGGRFTADESINFKPADRAAG